MMDRHGSQLTQSGNPAGRPRRARMLRGGAAVLVALAVLPPVHAGEPKGFVASQRAVALPGYARPGTGISGQFDATALESREIRVALPDGRVVTARRDYIERKPVAGATAWRGSFADSPGDMLVVSNVRGTVSAMLNYQGVTYELQPRGRSSVLFAVDESRLPPPGPLRPVRPTQDESALAPTDAVGTFAAADAPVLHDLLVLTTAAARARYGDGLDGMILNAVSNANAAYAAGAVGITLNLTGIYSTTVTEGARMEDALDAVAADPAARQLRDQFGADVVMLVSDNSDYCGIAYFMNSVSAAFAPYAYGVVSSRCLSVSTLAHEVGHVQGLAHDRETAGAGAGSSRPYAFGYRVCPTDGTGVRDIMSYACTSGTAARINEFSNPNRMVNGYVFGIAYEVDPLRAADAARALNDNAAVVAGFRQSVLSPPDTPTMLRVTGFSSTNVALAWSDNATDETGFALERSTDGVNWAEIARLAVNATTHDDVTVAAATTYSYRVRAFNDAGYSPASGVITIAVPAAPDTTPDPFAFASRSAVQRSTLVTSGAITVSGMNTAAPISVVGGEYSIGCGASFTSEVGSISSGQAVCVRHQSAATGGATVTTSLTIGGVTGTFSSTTQQSSTAGGSSSAGGGGGGGGSFDWLLALIGLTVGARRLQPWKTPGA